MVRRDIRKNKIELNKISLECLKIDGKPTIIYRDVDGTSGFNTINAISRMRNVDDNVNRAIKVKYGEKTESYKATPKLIQTPNISIKVETNDEEKDTDSVKVEVIEDE